MKRLATLAALLISAAASWAQPLLVGHRGSGYGLENSVESFTKGVELGYHYLETDIKRTLDGRFVCSHDDDTKRLGGTRTIASATLEQLQSETLTQTRSGVTYTGRICSLEEYLQIAKDAGIGCVVELKWTTGINNNDQTHIPALIKAIDDMGMRNRVIILTSMKPCLEYIRTNYPDITLQFLTGQYWKNHFDWCVQWKIDVDIQSGYFGKDTVEKFHDAGLKVNMWTTNDDAGYLNYGNMGCDFITTDRLDGHNLPDLDPSVVNPPNTVDFPRNGDVAVHGHYNLGESALTAWPAETDAVADAVRLPGGWAVLSPKGEAISIIGADGAVTPVCLDGVEGGSKAIGSLARTADGRLAACNLAEPTPGDLNAGRFKVYLWDNPAEAPRVILDIDSPVPAGTTGSALAVSGKGDDLRIYAATRPAEGDAPAMITRISLVKGEAQSIVSAPGPDNAVWGSDFTLGLAPTSRDNILIAGPSMAAATEYAFDHTSTPAALTPAAAAPAAIGGLAPAFFRFGAKVYALVPVRNADGSVSAFVADCTDGLDSAIPVTDTYNAAPAGEALLRAAVVTDAADGSITLEILAAGHGIDRRRFNPPSTATPMTLDLVLERQWILSNTTDNAPQHIHGTNAQQGTAVNGLFYVNDCADRLIYIFDNTGCIGSIPGGSGWGCTRDDAGNIIVRDDKSTGTKHRFIIYPAGARPDNYGTAVEIEADCTLDGQVNFINASGDLLGNGGNIYLYPNKQPRVAIIGIAGGKVQYARASAALRINGTTAGYILPLDNDRETWLYQVRTAGIYEYNGGTSSELFTGRSTTTQPQRNSTGGMALACEGDNRILVHNSGANYRGGFTVRDLTADRVLTSVEPIGTLGYVEGGNYSTFNWLILERKAAGDYVLYQYCPSNGMAVYTLRDKSLGVQSVAQPAQSPLLAGRNGNTLHLNAPQATVYNTAGIAVATVTDGRADISALVPGIYIIRSADGCSTRIAL